MRMRYSLRSLIVACGVTVAVAVPATGARAQDSLRLASPDGRNEVVVGVRDGFLWYAVRHEGKPIITPSRLGFAFRGAPTLFDSLRITDSTRATYDTTWTQPWGEVARVRDHHNELRVTVAETKAPMRKFTVAFRAFEDGVAFRYELPEQQALGDFEIMDELTEYTLARDAKAWFTKATVPKPDRYEMLYESAPASILDTVNAPLTLEMQDGPTVVLHEANLVDYAGIQFRGGPEQNRTLRIALPAWGDGVKVRGRTPFVTPWRTIQIADRPGDLHPQVLTLKLNPPSVLTGDLSWIKPMKYIGIWWGMHINTMTWSSGPKHGATTANTERYMDFAAKNGFGGVLVEGWNIGWDGDWYSNGNVFSFTKPYPDFDIAAIVKHGAAEGVGLIAHNETAMGIQNYERQIDSAFTMYEALGIHGLKTGYVGDYTLEGHHHHHSQYMVRHYRHVMELAAQHHIMLVAHEPIMDTGERRTYPNMMSREGSRGMEYNAWGGEGGNPPEHETTLFFTRMVAGPMDFTPGIFDLQIKRPTGTPRGPNDSRPRTTLAKQLALYVVIYAPLQMAADLPENYEGQPAFQFIRDVKTDWDTTRVLDGKIGDYVVVARKERGGPQWFVGGITDENGRTLDVPLSFLPKGKSYVAEIYADGPKAHYLDNPLPVTISKRTVTSAKTLRMVLAPGGGQAIRIRPAK